MSLPRIASPSDPSPSPPGSRGGFTLLELITVVALLGLLLGRALPAGRQLQDRMAVVAAREATVGLFHRARLEAVARGGATLTLDAEPALLTLSHGGTVLAVEDLAGEHGVTLALTRGRETVTLVFDALGLGRVASQTLRFRRGEALRILVVSSYGRVVRP